MRAVVQRVTRAQVRVDGDVIGAIDGGLLVLVGVGIDDGDDDAVSLARKIASLRIFRDDEGNMNRDVCESGGSALVISQFTLHGDVRKGRRPSFIAAARPQQAEPLYQRVVAELRSLGLVTATGRFGATMAVELVNDGPVTILLDTKRQF
ncbi:MAG TPA: D-aminoacyl-tRNA deacylase [Candidatus Acidoferrales bacterium]|nr:D-aminoacyl-tRNA deacylase [Candidatus Acidoferrales bacterium]